jgi:hypothetical protein
MAASRTRWTVRSGHWTVTSRTARILTATNRMARSRMATSPSHSIDRSNYPTEPNPNVNPSRLSRPTENPTSDLMASVFSPEEARGFSPQ